MARRTLPSAVLWAVAGMAAGASALASPWLALGAAGICAGAALWTGRRRPPQPTVPESGDLAMPWADPELDRLRTEVAEVWQRFQETSDGLCRSLTRLEARQGEWSRLLARGAANADTLTRSAYAQRGASTAALEALSATARQWSALRRQWDDLGQALQTHQAGVDQITASHVSLRQELQVFVEAWQGLEEAARDRELVEVAVSPGQPVSDLLLAMAEEAARIADETARLGRPGWGVALAATEWAERARKAAETQPASPAPPMPDPLQRALAIGRAALTTVQAAAAALPAEPAAVPIPGKLPEPDLEAAIRQLDAADHEGELGAGLAQDLAGQLAGWQGRARQLVEELAQAGHAAAELLILSGYVRTASDTPPCHLHRTVWCITDGDCERCPLTKLQEADFPGLMGPSGDRRAPKVAKTGRTIDLGPEDR